MTILSTAALTAILFGSTFTLSHGNHKQDPAPSSAQTQQMSMSEMCNQMMADKKQANSTMNDMDTKLENMLPKIDSTTGEEKTAAIVAVVKELVSQRSTMRQMRQTMDAKMMDHMMMHMKTGKKMCAMTEASMEH